MNSLKIQWNHLVYKDTFYCSDIIKKLYHRQPHGLDVKGIGRLHSFLGLQGITYKNKPLDNWGFGFWILVEFCFILHVDGDLGTTKSGSFGKVVDIHRHTFLE